MMELNPYLISLPAIIALLIKGGIYLYSRQSGQHNLRTRLYLALLLTFAIQNMAEISHFFTLGHNQLPYIAFYIFYISILFACAILVHLAIALNFEEQMDHRIWLIPPVAYVLLSVIVVFLISTDWVVTDIMPIGLSVSRVTGPLYFLFEFFVLGSLLTTVAVLYFGARNTENATRRARNSAMLLAIIPTVLIGFAVLIMLRLGVARFNGVIILPITMSFFLAVTAYAIHQHRLFDIQFYIPGTGVRKRKTSFYRRMRNMITEIADLQSVEEVIDRVSDTLRCPVALITGNKPVLAAATAASMASMPRNALSSIDHILVTREMEQADTPLHQALQHHGIAAVVPFYPHSEHASGWLLLGESFANTVYTPLDFRLVEELFDKMADLFLDKMLTIRTQLADTARALRQSEIQRLKLEQSLTSTQAEKQTLAKENLQLLSQQPADSVSLSHTIGTAPLSISITVLSRDKELLAQLKDQYPQLNSYAGLSSASFLRNPLPEVVIATVDSLGSSAEKRLRNLLQDHGSDTAFLFHGEATTQLRQRLSNLMRGGMIELIEGGANHERICRRSHALTTLKRFTRSIPYPDYPVIAHSRQMRDMLDQLQSHAGFHEPIAIISDEPMRAMAVARHMHDLHNSKQGFIAMECCQQENWLEAIDNRLSNDQPGTLFIELISPTTDHIRRMTDLARRHVSVRLMLSVSSSFSDQLDDSILTLRIPLLQNCHDDMPLLIHYYTLQYNMRATFNRYLSQDDANNIIADNSIRTLSQLKGRIFQLLDDQIQQQEPVLNVETGDKSLDEQMAEYEANIIALTLERCGGNKSKAARQLGLKPNTLHYKIERYGLSGKKK